MFRVFSVTTALLAATEVLAVPTAPKAATVVINNGTVGGKYVDSYKQDHFLGIPFAQPPLGDLRFNLPQPINKTWNETLNATAYGPMCTQYLLPIVLDPANYTEWYPQSEDCLTLNVVRPTGTLNKAKLPVMVYLYGGGFQGRSFPTLEEENVLTSSQEGGTSDARYNMSYMLQDAVNMGEPAIMVSVNYRLKGWGFLAGETVRGQGLNNVGLHDQRLALQWIQENIAAFGGDASRVTLFGESAGAISIGYHLLAYGGRDDKLFSAAVCQSGGPWFFGTYTTGEEDEATYQSILTATNCTTSHDTLQCLREAPFDVLNTAFAAASFLPTIDGGLIPEYNSVALAKGNFVKVPLIIGSNTDEGKIFTVPVTKRQRILENNNETLDTLITLYPFPGSSSLHGQSDDTLIPAGFGSQFNRVGRWMGDAMFTAGRRYTCELWAQHGVPCYSYRFNTVPADTDPIERGATHFMEVAFVFNNVPGTGMDVSAYSVEPASRAESYKAVGELMSRMWMAFAATHSPNNHKLSSFNTTWPAYTLDAPSNIVFDGNTTSFIEKDDYRSEALKFIIDSALDFGR
ncbi:putative extracellular lipase [Cadophora sp. DSE1049]|nr:putative extracellular lipase [Cadophora sp. DSE1049]